jgi:hypothetical protein
MQSCSDDGLALQSLFLDLHLNVRFLGHGQDFLAIRDGLGLAFENV